MDHLIYDALKDLLVKMVASDCLSKSFTANEFVCKAKSFLHDKKSETDIVQIADLLCSNLNSMSEQEWVTMLSIRFFIWTILKWTLGSLTVFELLIGDKTYGGCKCLCHNRF